MHNFYYLLFASLFFVASCTSESDQESQVKQIDQKKELIEKTAVLFANSFQKDKKQISTRGNFDSEIARINSYKFGSGKKTKGADITNDITAYSVSLSENRGTILLVENKDVVIPAAFFKGLKDIQLNEIMKDSTSELSFIVQTALDEGADNMNTRSFGQENKIVETVAPKCKVWWDQGIPYNIYCWTKGGKLAYAGCVPVAGAQALTVLQPKLPMITSWDSVINCKSVNDRDTTVREIANLIHYIGVETGVKYHELGGNEG